MGFAEALRENPVPTRVGDVRLAYDAPVLLGEAARAGRSLPRMLLLGGGFAAGGVVALVAFAPRGAEAVAVALALASAALFALALAADRAGRTRRRFALHFLDETLRLDLPGGWLRRPSAITVPFDDVRDLYVLREGAVYSLVADVAHRGRVVPCVLVGRVREAEREELRRLWTTLRAAFGITRSRAEG